MTKLLDKLAYFILGTFIVFIFGSLSYEFYKSGQGKLYVGTLGVLAIIAWACNRMDSISERNSKNDLHK